MGLFNLGSRAQPVYNPAGALSSGPVTIVNLDLVNPVYADYTSTVTGSSDLIGPLNSLIFDGSQTIWANAPSGNVQILIMPGSTGWTPSPLQQAQQLIAAGLATAANQVTQEISIPANMKAAGQNVTGEIAALLASGSAAGTPGGVPLLNFANQIPLAPPASVTGSVTLPAVGTFPISQIGYHGLLNISTTNVVATTLTIVLSWYVSGLFVGSDTFIVYACTTGSGNQHQIKLKGPTKGNELQVLLFASSGTVTLNSFWMFQDSRVYADDRWQSDQFTGAFPGFTAIAACDPDVYFLEAFSASIAAGTTDTFLLPYWTGKAVLSANTGSNTNDLVVAIFSAADSSIPATSNVCLITSDSIGDIALEQLWLPRAQCQLTLRNNNVAAKTINSLLVAADY